MLYPIKSIDNISEVEKKSIINNCYLILKEPNNIIRNNLILIDTEFKDIMMEIKKV